jgi:hypothetical protein
MDADSSARKPVTRLARIFLERQRPITFVAQSIFTFLQHVKQSAYSRLQGIRGEKTFITGDTGLTL